MKRFLILVLTFYKKLISPFLEIIFGKACRFNPSCSQYTLNMINKYGISRGVSLGLIQLSKCHSFAND